MVWVSPAGLLHLSPRPSTELLHVLPYSNLLFIAAQLAPEGKAHAAVASGSVARGHVSHSAPLQWQNPARAPLSAEITPLCLHLQRRASSTCLLVFRKCHYWFVPTEWLIGSYGKCCLGRALPAFRPHLQARTPRERCLSVLPGPLPVPPTATLCHPEEGWPILLPPGILKLRGVVAVSPGAHLSLAWQGALPAGLRLSLPLRLSQFPTCTAPLLSGIFPDLPRAEQHLCCHFQDVWIWVCTEDPRSGGFCTLDGCSLLQSTFCSLNHSQVFFLDWQFSCLVYPCLDFTKHISQGKQVSSCRWVTASVYTSKIELAAPSVSIPLVQFLYCSELDQNPKLLFPSSPYILQNY